MYSSVLEMCIHYTNRYKNDPEIKAMTDLVDAYQRREVHAAEKILKGELPPNVLQDVNVP